MSKIGSSSMNKSRVAQQEPSIEMQLESLEKKMEKFPERQFSEEDRAGILNPEKREEPRPKPGVSLEDEIASAMDLLQDVESELNLKRTWKRDAVASSLQNSFTQPNEDVGLLIQE